MNKHVVFMYYRGGSTLLMKLMDEGGQYGKKLGITIPEHFYKLGRAWVLPVGNKLTLARLVPCGNLEESLQEETPSQFTDYICLTRIGNWWGNCRAALVPDPYGDPSPMKWSAVECSGLSGVNTFSNHIRDGRNQVSSFWNLKGGIEEKLRTERGQDYFVSLCKGWRNQARIAIDCQALLGNYSICHFEDTFADPFGSLSKLYGDMGLEIDEEFYGDSSFFKSVGVGTENHSSFGTKKSMNIRWGDWTKEQYSICMSIMKKELVELGYEKG